MTLATSKEISRPLLRGWIHLASAVLAPFALLWLILEADSPRGYVGGAVFGSSLIVLFATSAAFHVIPWRPGARDVVRRIDHSVIFVAVAGAYTPFCLQVLGAGWGISILSLVGGLAAAGILVRQAWPHTPRGISVSLYLVVAWVAIVAAPVIMMQLQTWSFLMLLGAGIMYSIAAVSFALRWPDPAPRIFGFHEVFHAGVTLASSMLFVVIAWDVLPR